MCHSSKHTASICIKDNETCHVNFILCLLTLFVLPLFLAPFPFLLFFSPSSGSWDESSSAARMVLHVVHCNHSDSILEHHWYIIHSFPVHDTISFNLFSLNLVSVSSHPRSHKPPYVECHLQWQGWCFCFRGTCVHYVYILFLIGKYVIPIQFPAFSWGW